MTRASSSRRGRGKQTTQPDKQAGVDARPPERAQIGAGALSPTQQLPNTSAAGVRHREICISEEMTVIRDAR
ncbi:hypothetical protein FA95DRAFT_1553884 [Auriscalpium vulgare]|uniref:Uncharacterized protein n=1 Tax=Auriscalpium vulgare TaxID=40419 RepID=A0ACB8S7Q0_9AGAM|nr:hypothetical protein FA95DRAFT_1553884 [Auriscalpium vulgare]